MPKKLDIPQENELTPEETTPPQETLTKPKRALAKASVHHIFELIPFFLLFLLVLLLMFLLSFLLSFA